MATLKFGVFAVSSTFLPSWMLMEYWCINCKWCLLFFPRFAVRWEFASIAGSGMKSLFTGIDSTRHSAFSSDQKIYWLMLGLLPMSFFICLFIHFIVIDILFQINRLEPSSTDSVFRFRFHDSISSFISCSGDEAKTKTPGLRLDSVFYGCPYTTVNSFVLFAWRRIAGWFPSKRT